MFGVLRLHRQQSSRLLGQQSATPAQAPLAHLRSAIAAFSSSYELTSVILLSVKACACTEAGECLFVQELLSVGNDGTAKRDAHC